MSDEYDVKVYIYDLSRGLARSLSQAFLGKQLDGVWHTGVVVYGQEFFYGGAGGIESCQPGGTILGNPDEIYNAGKTQIPYDMFINYLQDLAQFSYRSDKYHLFHHNCNTFSADIAQFLTGNSIPAKITSLPEDVLSTPFGQMIKPFVDAMSVGPGGGHVLFPSDPASVAPSTSQQPQQPPASSASGGQSKTSNPETNQSKAEKEQNTSATRAVKGTQSVDKEWKPVVFDEKVPDVSEWKAQNIIDSIPLLEEIYEYYQDTSGFWALGRTHLEVFRQFILEQKDNKLCIFSLKLLEKLVLKEDFNQLLQHDPKCLLSEILGSYENQSEDVQLSILKMVTNCCSTESGCTLLLSSKEIKSGSSPLTQVCKVCAMSHLSESDAVLQAGAALGYNMCRKKLGEDGELEIGTAMLQAASRELDETTAFYILSSLDKLLKISSELRDLAGVLGTDFEPHRKLSDRTTQLCDSIEQQINVV